MRILPLRVEKIRIKFAIVTVCGNAYQKKILQKAAKEKGYTDTLTFVDDGISGTTMNRPGFQKMVQAIENGYISAVFVKDLSRLGRNYIEVGRLTELHWTRT